MFDMFLSKYAKTSTGHRNFPINNCSKLNWIGE